MAARRYPGVHPEFVGTFQSSAGASLRAPKLSRAAATASSLGRQPVAWWAPNGTEPRMGRLREASIAPGGAPIGGGAVRVHGLAPEATDKRRCAAHVFAPMPAPEAVRPSVAGVTYKLGMHPISGAPRFSFDAEMDRTDIPSAQLRVMNLLPAGHAWTGLRRGSAFPGRTGGATRAR